MTHADIVSTLLSWVLSAPWWTTRDDQWAACSILVDLASDRRCWAEA